MKRRCPDSRCNQVPFPHTPSRARVPQSTGIIRKGSFYRKRDRRFITRYFCRNCGRNFSSSTHSPDYRQKKPELNPVILQLICSGVGQRRLAILLEVNPKTVVRKFRLLAERSRISHAIWRRGLARNSILEIQFDDLESFEHTKCKPLSVALAVNKETREIIDVFVSAMPVSGPLVALAKKRNYPKRKDMRPEGWERLISGLRDLIRSDGVVESDENPRYPGFVKRHLRGISHLRYKGARGAITGQGELKKLVFDPLFSLNHTCAMFRANVNRLVRRTWCTSKTRQGLIDHLSIYIRYHNEVLLNPGYPVLQAQ